MGETPREQNTKGCSMTRYLRWIADSKGGVCVLDFYDEWDNGKMILSDMLELHWIAIDEDGEIYITAVGLKHLES